MWWLLNRTLFLYLDLEIIPLYILMQTQRQAHKTCACPYNIDEPDATILNKDAHIW